MRLPIVAVFALAVPTALAAQSATTDLSVAVPIAGTWVYGAATDGSEARFTDGSGNPQLFVRCTRSTRRISIAKPATAAAPAISVWTSSLARNVPSSFNPATGRLTIELGAYDPLLDAMVSSRGRIGFTVGTTAPLVLPPWAELARAIEDCRV